MIEWLRKEASEPEIELSGRKLPIALRRHPRARRLTLRLAPDGSEVRLTLPRWCASREAIAFVYARKEWLESELEKIPQPSPPVPGGHLSYRGKNLHIEWNEGASRIPKVEGNSLKIGGPGDNLTRRLQRWLESEAIAVLREDLSEYCSKAGQSVPDLRLSRAQRRWGSCSTSGVVRINWRLIQAPDFVRQSVVAHEVAHLVHFDHSPAFKNLLSAIYGGSTSKADSWLRQHGRQLYASFG